MKRKIEQQDIISLGHLQNLVKKAEQRETKQKKLDYFIEIPDNTE